MPVAARASATFRRSRGRESVRVSCAVDLTPDTLTGYLRHRYYDRKLGHPEDIQGELYVELRRAGYATVESLAAMLDRTEKAFESRERTNPPNGDAGSRFAVVGVVRISLSLDPGRSVVSGDKYRTLDSIEPAREALAVFLERYAEDRVRDVTDALAPALPNGWLLEREGLYCLLRVPDM